MTLLRRTHFECQRLSRKSWMSSRKSKRLSVQSMQHPGLLLPFPFHTPRCKKKIYRCKEERAQELTYARKRVHKSSPSGQLHHQFQLNPHSSLLQQNSKCGGITTTFTYISCPSEAWEGECTTPSLSTGTIWFHHIETHLLTCGQ